MPVARLSGFFMWDPSAAVSREPSVPAFGLHQRLTSNVVLQLLARVAPAHCASRNVGYRLMLVDSGLSNFDLGF